MTPDTSNYFLLVFAQPSGELGVEEFGDDGARAMTEYSRRERAYSDRPEIEVVLVGADSLATIKKTHSHYFRASTESLLADLQEDLSAV